MHIKQAKTQIANTLRAYLQLDENGCYLIPPVRQRPVLLIGPPGIGKTQIMEQIAFEENVGLVSYTMTHHTRQSAVGLPFIEKHVYAGEEYNVTEYTMSEIIGSVHSLMERTGIKNGILFLDEINCVSETLAPMMLQFLQCKTFGNQRLPEGWLIVAAGNPPEYNKSVRDFDVVTLDRMKKITVEENFAVWKEYALKKHLHGAVVSYLDIKKENFYHIEKTADGIQFATARGWEDLSELIYTYEKLSYDVDYEVVEQYIQMPRIARDFANYLALYYKYNREYHIDEILDGRSTRVTEDEFRKAPFDEKYAVLSLMLSRLSDAAGNVWKQDEITAAVYAALKSVEKEEKPYFKALEDKADEKRTQLKLYGLAGQTDKFRRSILSGEIALLEIISSELGNTGYTGADEKAWSEIKRLFGSETEKLDTLSVQTGRLLDNAFRFLERAVGQGQEIVLFVTDLTASENCSWYISQFGCEAYYRHNSELLINDTRNRIVEEIISGE